MFLSRSALCCFLFFLTASAYASDPDRWPVDRLAKHFEKFQESTSDTEVIHALRETRSKPIVTLYHHREVKDLDARKKELLSVGFALRENKPLQLNSPIDWGVNPEQDRNWHFQVNSLYMNFPFLISYEQTKNSEDLQVVKDVWSDWIQYNLVKGNENAFKWYDMAVGIRASQLAFLIDQLLQSSDSGFSELLPQLIHAAVEHVNELSDPGKLKSNNHGLFQLVGLGQLCQALPELASCIGKMEYAQQKFYGLITLNFHEEGIYLEHSPEYQIYTLEMLRRIEKTGLFREVFESSLIKDSYSALLWMFHPNGRLASIGDSGRQSIQGVAHYHPHLSALATSSPEVRNLPPPPAVFTDSGYFIHRSSWSERPLKNHSYLFFAAAFHSLKHKHADALSFEWSEFGELLLVDSGKYGYNKDAFRRYVTSPVAHNTVAKDGSWLNLKEERPFGSALLSNGQRGDLVYVSGEVTRESQNFTQRRTLVLREKKWLVVVDHITSKETASFSQWFQLASDFELVEGSLEELEGRISSSSRLQFSLPEKALYLSLKPLIGNQTAEVLKGEQEPEIAGWRSNGYLRMLPANSVRVNAEGQAIVFATLLYLSDKAATFISEPSFQSSKGEISACWKEGKKLDGFRLFRSESERIISCSG